MAQVVMSFVAADYAVEAGIPFVGFGPLRLVAGCLKVALVAGT
jgi:hypothetical protein